MGTRRAKGKMLITPPRVAGAQDAAGELQMMNLTSRRRKTRVEVLAELQDVGKVEREPESWMVTPNRLHQP